MTVFSVPFFDTGFVEPGDRESVDASPVSEPLQKLPPGPWRSLGGYLDYTDWPERDRFAELDQAIQAPWRHSPERYGWVIQFRRCRAKTPDGHTCRSFFHTTEQYDGWKCEAHREKRIEEAPSSPALNAEGLRPAAAVLSA